MKKIFVIIFALALCSFNADTPSSGIPAGEKLIFTGSYNMSGLMTKLAQVTMSTESVNTSKNNYLHISCELSTFAKWDSFFKIRDIYESYVNPTTMMPSLYNRSINEGGYIKKEKYVFKGTTVTSTTSKKNKIETTRKFTIGASTQDVVSMMYKLRTMDLASMKSGATKSFTIVFDEKQIPVTIKMIGVETVDAANLGEKKCYKLSIGAKTNVLKGTDKNLIWLTADTKKVPVLMKFSIPVGTGQLVLSSATGI